METSSFGEVITFYSYKGGTGRTMALANVGCVLANGFSGGDGMPPRYFSLAKRPVLCIDWDLEAPGLHHFLPVSDAELDNRDGLLELFTAVRARAREVKTREDALDLFRSVHLDDFVSPTGVAGLWLLHAGRLDATYGSRVNAFSWEELFTASPPILPAFAEFVTSHYAYTLIDSRTGITDVSGICTTVMPSKLVVVFTPNRQSLTGIFDLVRRATLYRSQSSDWRPLAVFPLPSRIEQAREQLLEEWRYGNDVHRGFQPEFEGLFRDVYGLPECDLSEYFTEVQIQHVPDYAYGEQVAVLVETESRLSLKRSYEEFSDRLQMLQGPWEDPAVVRAEREIAGRLSEVSKLLADRESLHAWGLLRSVLEVYRGNPKVKASELPELLDSTATVLKANGKLKEAFEMLEAAVQVEEREGGTAVSVRLIELADSSSELGMLDRASEHARRAFALAIHENQLRTAVDALVVIADVERAQGRGKEAVDALQKALEIQASLNDVDSRTATLLLKLAETYARSGQNELAKVSFALALKRLGDFDQSDVHSAQLLRSAAGVAEALNDLEGAEQLVTRALDVQRRVLGTRAPETADTFEQLGNVLLKRGQTGEALRLFQEVYYRRSSALDKSDPAVIGILRKIGLVSTRLGDLPTARERYEDALASAATLATTHSLHLILRRELAEILVKLGEVDHAEEMASEAIVIARQMAALSDLAHLVALRADIRAKRDPDSAMADYHEAIEIRQQIGDRGGEAHLRLLLARLLAATKRREEARAQLLAAQAINRSLERHATVTEIERELTKL